MTGTSCAWKILLASVQGTKHLRENIACQDFCSAKIQESEEEEILILSASDGAGSASFSHIGSRAVCDRFQEYIKEWLEVEDTFEDGISEKKTQNVSLEVIHELHTALLECSKEYELSIKEFACTFLGAVLWKDRAWFWQIGDGAIIVEDADTWIPIFWPQSGEYINQTYFVSDTEIFQNFMFKEITRSVAELAIFTDGLQSLALKLDTRSVFSPFFQPIFKQLGEIDHTWLHSLQNSMEIFLNSEKINSKTDDDKTLVVAKRITL